MKLKRNQIVNPIIVIVLPTSIFLFFLQREKEIRQHYTIQINGKQNEINDLFNQWDIYKQIQEEKIKDLNAQIAVLRTKNIELENKKQEIKTIYYEKYIEIRDYNVTNVVDEFNSIFAANNIE